VGGVNTSDARNLDPANLQIGYRDALIRSRAMAPKGTDVATFGAEIAAAYATKGGAIELGTAKLGGVLVPEAAVRVMRGVFGS
jgi:hypothetical protein